MSSIKSMIGHTMGTASAIEAITCALVVKNDIIPPTINYCEPDPECDLNYVPNVAREHRVHIAISNAYANLFNDSFDLKPMFILQYQMRMPLVGIMHQ